MGFIASFFARSVFGISYKALGIVILIASMVAYRAYLIHEIHSEQSKADKAITQLNDYITAVKVATARREAENAAKLAESQKVAESIKAERDEALKKVGLEKTTVAQLRKDLENEKTNIVNALNDAYQLRLSTAISSATTTGEVPKPTEGLAESARNLNGTIAVVTRACADTTIAYNSLMESWEKNCKIYGCEP